MNNMDKTIILRYLGAEHENFIVCKWAIELLGGISGKEIVDVKKWTDETVDLMHTARVWLKRTNPGEYPPKYELIISGRGRDERCTWCRSFRTALETHINKLKYSIDQKGSCDFD